MFSRYGLLVVAIGLVAFPAGSLAQEPSGPAQRPTVEQFEPQAVPGTANTNNDIVQEEPEREQAQPPSPPQVGTDVGSAPSDPEADINGAEVNHDFEGLQRPEVDPQQSMAESTGQMVVAARIGLVISFFTLLLILGTLLYTRKAAGAAVNTFAAQIRPVLIVEPPTVDELLRWRDSDFENRLNFRMRNVGSGPAIVKILSRAWAVAEKGEMPPIHRIVPESELRRSERQRIEESIGGSTSVTKINEFAVGAGELSEDNWSYSEYINPDVDNRPWIFFYGCIEYDDIGMGRYRSGFCFLLIRDVLDDEGRGFRLPWEPEAEKYNYHHVLKKPKVRE